MSYPPPPATPPPKARNREQQATEAAKPLLSRWPGRLGKTCSVAQRYHPSEPKWELCLSWPLSIGRLACFWGVSVWDSRPSTLHCCILQRPRASGCSFGTNQRRKGVMQNSQQFAIQAMGEESRYDTPNTKHRTNTCTPQISDNNAQVPVVSFRSRRPHTNPSACGGLPCTQRSIAVA